MKCDKLVILGKLPITPLAPVEVKPATSALRDALNVAVSVIGFDPSPPESA